MSIEPLIFDLASPGRIGFSLPEVDIDEAPALDPNLTRQELDLPELSEIDVTRHYTRLSQKNYSIDTGFYPLGSCTMKHNPRLNEKMARLPGFAEIHPFQPVSTIQGAFELIDTCAVWLKELTGMAAVAMSPAAGA